MNDVPAVLEAIRDHLAYALHEHAHGPTDTDDPDNPCWWSWRPQADALMPLIRPHLITAWERGAREGKRGCLWMVRNPYRDHGSSCVCQFCYVAAMGGGR